MQLYDAVCRPGGQLTHEVPKHGLSAPEVILLRSIHGDDGVVRLKHSKMKREDGIDEIDRLKHIYGDKIVTRVFGGTFGSTLPKEVPGEWLNGGSDRDEEDEPSAPRKAASPPKPN